jgi:MFS family permease
MAKGKRGHWLKLDWLSPDGRRLLLTRVLRGFGYGYLGVILAIYLEQIGLSTLQVGLVLGAAVAGSAVMNILWSLLADRYGRRRTVATMAVLMALGGALFAVGGSVWVLIAAAFTGTISASSAEVGPFLTVEQAILPQTTDDLKRTRLFAVYDTLGTVAGAVGSLFAGSVAVFAALGLRGADAYRPLFVLYGAIGLANLALFARLSPAVETVRIEGVRRFIGVHRSARVVALLSALFALDALAGGLIIQSLVAYWFHLRWGLSPQALGILFFWAGLLSGSSLLVAGWLAGRIGLLNTIVFTHLPSNLLLILVPLAPASWMAVAVYLARTSLSQMDVPTRRSYTMAVVDPDERTATAGITNASRTVSSAVSPVLTALAFSLAALGLPFIAAGVMKVVYDLLLYFSFRNLHPPEEVARRSRTTGRPA